MRLIASECRCKKYFLFKYWKDRYPTQTEAAYQGYMNVVKAVDNQFYSAFGKDIIWTDRAMCAYIFLQIRQAQ